jgi:hypothetical protein
MGTSVSPWRAVQHAVFRRWSEAAAEAKRQALTLVHFSAQLKRLLWDRGCVQGDLRGCLGGVRGY